MGNHSEMDSTAEAIKSRTRQVFDLFLGTALLQGANILTSIFLARWLGVVQYGSYRQLFLIHQVCVAVFFSAFPGAVLYFCGPQKPEARGIVVRRHLVVVLVIGSGLSIILRYGNSFFASCLNSPIIVEVLPWFACYPAAFMVYSLMTPTLVCYGRTKVSVICCVILACLNSIPVLLVASHGFELKFIAATATGAAWVGASGAIVGILILSRNQRSTFRPPSFFEMATYMGPLLLASGISFVGLRMDQFIVSYELGPEIYGIYAAGALEIPLFSMLSTSVTNVLLPQFSSLAKERNWAEIKRIWRRSLVHSAIMVFPVAATLMMLAEPFITTVFGDRYIQAVPIFRVYLLFAPIRIAAFGLVLRASGRTKPDFYGAVLYFPLVMLLVHFGLKLFGVIGAAIGVLLATIMLAAFLSHQTKRLTEGTIGFLGLYPLPVLVAFPCIGGVIWLLLHSITWVISPTPPVLLALGAGIAVGLATGGRWIMLNVFSERIYNETNH